MRNNVQGASAFEDGLVNPTIMTYMTSSAEQLGIHDCSSNSSLRQVMFREVGTTLVTNLVATFQSTT